MSGWKRYGLVFLGAAVVAGLPACGGSGSVTQTCPAGQTGTPPNCTTPPPPCTQTKVYSDIGFVQPKTVQFFDFSVPDSGRLDITLDWTFVTSPIGFYIVPAVSCNTVEEFNARTCTFIVQSEPSATKPKKISQNFSAGNYRWLIANYSNDPEAANLLINLSKGSCPALTSTGVDASAHGPEELPKIERIVRQ